jgi:hypothetical protein
MPDALWGKVDQDQSPIEEEKIIWGGECQVHRPLFTGHFGESAMLTDQVPGLPISLHRFLPIGRWQKKVFYARTYPLNS